MRPHDPRNSRYAVGIDPGNSGGACHIQYRRDGSWDCQLGKFADTQPFLRWLAAICKPVGFCKPTICLENVWGGPKMSSNSAFQFGRAAGMVEGVVTVSRYQQLLHPVPQVWQKHFGLIIGTSADQYGGSEKKKVNRAYAELKIKEANIVLGGQITDYTADAVLLALYARDIDLRERPWA